MTRVELARLALRSADEYRALLLSGQVSPLDAWYVSTGARRYAEAIAAGDIATDETISRRRDFCRGCPTRVRITVQGARSPSDFCGEPFTDRTCQPNPSCGCPCAAMTAVGSKRCPQGKW